MIKNDKFIGKHIGNYRIIEEIARGCDTAQLHAHPDVLKTNTQSAIDALADAGALDAPTAQKLDDAYRFLRRVESGLRLLDTSARHDLHAWLHRLVDEDDPHFTHKQEGPDDMPSHIKAALTSVSLGIPIASGELALGRWQGIYLWEHRRQPHQRTVVVHIA